MIWLNVLNFQEVTPIAKKLVKTVFANCAPKLKPYLAQAVESLDLSLDEYSKSLTSVLEGTHIAVELGNDSSLRDQLVNLIFIVKLCCLFKILMLYCPCKIKFSVFKSELL